MSTVSAKRHAVITSTGSYVPERVVTDAELSETLGALIQPFVSETLGMRERRVTAPGESTADLAEQAARRALAAAGRTAQEMDRIIVATETPEYMSPATSSVLTVLGANGQTEHLCVAFNRPGRYRRGTVGLPMPGTTLRVAEGGEVLVRRSGLTFSGYHRRPRETTDVFTDDGAWLRTGDLGAVDADGFLQVTGRKKEILALSNGKKLAPLAIESRLCESPLIAQAMLYSEGRPYVTALLARRSEAVERWRERGLEGTDAELARHPALVEEVRELVDEVNADVSLPERVRRLHLLTHELTPDAGELTPPHKLKRAAVSARCASVLDALYEEPE